MERGRTAGDVLAELNNQKVGTEKFFNAYEKGVQGLLALLAETSDIPNLADEIAKLTEEAGSLLSHASEVEVPDDDGAQLRLHAILYKQVNITVSAEKRETFMPLLMHAIRRVSYQAGVVDSAADDAFDDDAEIEATIDNTKKASKLN